MLRQRVTTSTGAVVDQPTAGELSELVAEVDRSGRAAFLIVERRATGAGETYLQARRDSVGWQLELRDGGPNRQYEATVADTAIVSATIAAWMTGVRAWQGLTWRHRTREHWAAAFGAGLAHAV